MSENDTRYDKELLGWTAPNGDKAVQLWQLGSTGEFQVREITFGGGGTEYQLYPATPEGLTDARSDARLRAQIIRFNQTGK